MTEPAIEYDEDLALRLRLYETAALGRGEDVVIQCAPWRGPGLFNTCLRFVTLHELPYDWYPDRGEFIIHPPA